MRFTPKRIQLFFLSFTCLFFYFPGHVLAQGGNGQQNVVKQIRVSGRLADSASRQAIPFGSVLLKNETTQQSFSMTTDSLGYFSFGNVPLGKYTLKAFYVGYPQVSRSLTVFSSGKVMKLGNVYMPRSKNVLKEVSVLGYKDLVQQRPDGIEYLAEKDPTNKGASAAELLQKVPMLTVDMDDNLQLRGNGNVKVLIDGKPSSVIAASVSDVLKQIPADNIKSVQVITSPGAKYDAEGSAGVVNIITKKSFLKGISGRVFSGVNYNLVDKHTRGHGGIDLNYRHDKLGISANLGGGHWSHTSETYASRISHPGTINEERLSQESFRDGGGNFMWGRLSADYSFDSLNTVSAGFGLHPGNWKTETEQTTTFPAYDMDYIQIANQSSPRMRYSLNAAYNKKFRNNPGRTLDFLALFSSGKRDRKYTLNQNDLPENVLAYQEENTNKTHNKEFTFQTDYTHPLKNHHQKLETGLKYINRDVSSDYELLSKDSTTGGDWRQSPNRTNMLQYTQQVASAYGQFTTDLTAKLSLIAGLRYEFTNISGSLRDNGGSFQSQFNNFLPSAIFSYKLRDFDRLSLSYTQRIERPSIDYINPYINSRDPLNVSQGNPHLSPEQIHKVELNYNTMLGGTSLNLATFYSHTENGIEAFTEIDNNGVAVTSYGNFASNNTYGMNLFSSATMFNRWRVNVNGNLYHKSLTGATLDVDNEGWQYDAHLSTNVDVYKGLTVSGFAMYRGRDVLLQGTRSGWYRYSIGLKKDIFKGKGEISLSAQNFLSPNIKTIKDFDYGDALYRTVAYRRSRGIRIGFSYNFGSMKFEEERSQRMKNSDLKGSSQQDNGSLPMGG